MKIEIAIDDRVQYVNIPDENLLSVLEQNEIQTTRTGVDAVEYSLDNPIGKPDLETIVKPGEKIAIITSDVTRPLPSYKVLPSIVDRLYAAGCKAEDITIIFALGAHRFHTEDEMKNLVGDRIFSEIVCIDSDDQDLVHLGTTANGTPVDVFKPVAEADRRICIGNIEYHYFAGYSGGAKAIMPGVSSREAIQVNHSKMTDPKSFAGNAIDNPVRDDLEEAINLFCPIDFICNVVLDEHKEIIYAVSGDFIKAHRVGCDFLDTLYLKKIEQRADIVIVSQGGKPKDLNMYQTQKALDNAKHAIKNNGIIILVGSCKEGLGESVFEEWILEAKRPVDLIKRIEKDFKLGGHKAAAIAMVLKQADIYLVSDMEDELVEKIFMKPFETVQAAYEAAINNIGYDASVIVMPYGGSTLPRCITDA